jgi:hypothetical protein
VGQVLHFEWILWTIDLAGMQTRCVALMNERFPNKDEACRQAVGQGGVKVRFEVGAQVCGAGQKED